MMLCLLETASIRAASHYHNRQGRYLRHQNKLGAAESADPGSS